ncbi:restriction endonuclease subunit S [Vibrio alginolyticus]|uniref:restriction endonuclease subunit S n=1 Tax=Gammaproteobacteria TaxID=1236 RepID=UPI001601CF24|nr:MULTISPECIES: restriction endonuclease subunit S [Gammaproteobacteria]MBB1506161.1 restriction endonuclease subunit S [Pseudoalteromonas sp. SG41-1]MDW1643001.1 restriction endonuclease subunit S [Vibrio sp. Vb2976]
MESLALMPKYESYKESGAEWLGDIPDSWELLSNKHIFTLKKKLVGKRSADYDLLSLTLRGIIKRDMDNPEGKFPAEFNTYQEVNCGDFVFCLFDVEETPRTVGLSSYDGMITGAYTVFQTNAGFDNKFLYYFYLNLDSTKRLKPLYRGLRNTIPKDSFMSFKTFVPLLGQQTLIANFLDKKTTQINDAIAIKEQQINLLKERKQIIIQQAVTQGLDPNVPMKDSGVDWIGKIPEHWEVKRLKYVLEERNERSKTGEEPLFMVSQVHGLVVRADYHDKAEVAASNIDNKVVYKNDLVFNKLKAHLGVFFKSNIEFKGLVSPDYAVYKCKEHIYDAKYLEILFRHPSYIQQFIIRATGVVEGLIRLYTGDLFDIPVPVAPSGEQAEILAYTKSQSSAYEKAIEIQQNQIEMLKEYKTSLINSAVTGKIKITPEMVEQ